MGMRDEVTLNIDTTAPFEDVKRLEHHIETLIDIDYNPDIESIHDVHVREVLC